MKEHGHGDVPSAMDVYECELTLLTQTGLRGHKFRYQGQLGLWLQQQRVSRPLLPYQEALFQRLAAEGKLSWEPLSQLLGSRDLRHRGQLYTWAEHFAALMRFLEVCGHCNVPLSSADASGELLNDFGLFECELPNTASALTKPYRGHLGAWLRFHLQPHFKLASYQQQQINSLIDAKKIDLETVMRPSPKDNISRYFDSTFESFWDLHYSALLAYVRLKGHGNVPYDAFFECALIDANSSAAETGASHSSEETQTRGIYYANYLGRWLQRQRLGREHCRLSLEHEKHLQLLVDQCKFVCLTFVLRFFIISLLRMCFTPYYSLLLYSTLLG